MSLIQTVKDSREELKKALLREYEGILPVEALEKSNPWYLSHQTNLLLTSKQETLGEVVKMLNEGCPIVEDKKVEGDMLWLGFKTTPDTFRVLPEDLITKVEELKK